MDTRTITLIIVSLKSGFGASTLIISHMQMLTRRLTSLSSLWSRPCLMRESLSGLTADFSNSDCFNSGKALVACCKEISQVSQYHSRKSRLWETTQRLIYADNLNHHFNKKFLTCLYLLLFGSRSPMGGFNATTVATRSF